MKNLIAPSQLKKEDRRSKGSRNPTFLSLSECYYCCGNAKWKICTHVLHRKKSFIDANKQEHDLGFHHMCNHVCDIQSWSKISAFLKFWEKTQPFRVGGGVGNRGTIDKVTWEFLTNKYPKLATFYTLPKTHESPPHSFWQWQAHRGYNSSITTISWFIGTPACSSCCPWCRGSLLQHSARMARRDKEGLEEMMRRKIKL